MSESNERLISFLSSTCSLLQSLIGKDAASQMQRNNIVSHSHATVESLSKMLEEARELVDLYDDRPGDDPEDFSMN